MVRSRSLCHALLAGRTTPPWAVARREDDVAGHPRGGSSADMGLAARGEPGRPQIKNARAM